MIAYFRQFVNSDQRKNIRLYLLGAVLVLLVFAIWFSNINILPLNNWSDFGVLTFLALLFALYRPAWSFAFFLAAVVLENVNISPGLLGISLRPYQWIAGLVILAMGLRLTWRKNELNLFRINFFDILIILFVLAGFVSALGANEKGLALKQSLVALSLGVLYFLTRLFLQNKKDLQKVLPFFFLSSLLVLFWSIWQNWLFMRGLDSFEVMPGRPNGTFAEADWLGMFVAFFQAIVLALIYKWEIKKKNKKEKTGHEFAGLNLFFVYVIFSLSWVVLFLSVTRSAWLAGAFSIILLGKLTLTKGSWRYNQWDWKLSGQIGSRIIVSIVAAFFLIKIFSLSNFEFLNRAQSISSGDQEITISCQVKLGKDRAALPEKIQSVEELSVLGCHHINLEEIEMEKSQGNWVTTILRPDPNVSVRSEIYQKSWQQIGQHWLGGIGWGNIGKILGEDERGTQLNSSNIFLEIWLGAGLLGFLAWLIVWFGILAKSIKLFYLTESEEKTWPIGLLLAWTAITFSNLFNAGIFLGFLWVYLAVAVSLTSEICFIKNKRK